MSSWCPDCIHEVNPGNQCPPDGSVLTWFSQIVINDNLTIPEQKPDIEQIVNVNKNFKVEDLQVIDVDLGDVQGKKIYVAGTLTLGIEYSAAVETQEVHFAHFKIPFKAFIKQRPCPGSYRGLIDPDFDLSTVRIRICVEHEQYHVISLREISKVLVVLIWFESIIP